MRISCVGAGFVGDGNGKEEDVVGKVEVDVEVDVILRDEEVEEVEEEEKEAEEEEAAQMMSVSQYSTPARSDHVSERSEESRAVWMCVRRAVGAGMEGEDVCGWGCCV